MAKVSKGEKRPADVVGVAAKVAKNATDKEEELREGAKNKPSQELGARPARAERRR